MTGNGRKDSCVFEELDNSERGKFSMSIDTTLPTNVIFQLCALLIELIVLLYRIVKAVIHSLFRFIFAAPDKFIYGETVLITGSGNGLGRNLALEFGKRGANLVLIDCDRAGNEETLKKLKAAGCTAYPYTCDLSNRNELYSVVDRIKTDIGQIDIIVNNAATLSGKPLLESSDDVVDNVFEVNTMAYIWLTKAFLPDMLNRNHGHVVNIASLAGVVGMNGLADYCASKSAVIGFTEALQYELRQLKRYGVHLTLVCPSYLGTGMFQDCVSSTNLSHTLKTCRS
ncbi:putative epidermal retinol dehydrogenase 2 [Apostichopus japonicus]|uniref:Short-chain dehydrogenase/reductase 3 n=1 Tax=Stichopus japonicus TaxID=307972 RepID=A0A2G8K5P8_STIJA|nr:putative epidermal retinol dehydrogenase 2 [Apostichopus japonicus]